MKRILGLDLGTNSIGWALIEIDHETGILKIIGLGSRILPMDAGEIKKFEEGGKTKSTAAQRTEKRGGRHLNERFLLRRDRLHLVLNLLEALPEHYKLDIQFTNEKDEKCGQFKKNKEPKLAYLPKQPRAKAEFIFKDSYLEMLKEINCDNIDDKKNKRIPYDWTLYYLRQKALSEKISLEELSWVLLSYNQKRGYEKTEVIDKSNKEDEMIEELDLQVKNVIPKIDNKGNQFYEIHLDGNDGFKYNEYSNIQMTFKGDLKEIIKTTKVDEEGNTDIKKTEFTVVDIYSLKIEKVDYEKADGKHKYILTYQNGWKEEKPPVKSYTYKYANSLNKPYDYIVETVYTYKGDIKKQRGKERGLREPDIENDNSSDWTLLKKKTEKEALNFNIDKGYKNKDGSAKSYISPKIYSVLKNDAQTGCRTKIIGGMFQVVDRDFYREELKQIIKTQRKFHYNLENKTLFEKCVETLYPKNKDHAKNLLNNKDAIEHLLVEDILLYQRPLKSKKSEIANCKYEIRYWQDIKDKNGEPIEETDIETGELKQKKKPIYRKVVPSSHPYFQEFRIWDKLHNLRLIQLEKEVNGKVLTNQDVTKEYFKSEKNYQDLYTELNNRKSLNQAQFLSYCKKKFKIDYNIKESNYIWNFSEDDEIKGNETRVSFATRFKRCGFVEYADFLTQEKEKALWHYLHSVGYKERIANDNKSAISFFKNYFKDFDIEDEVREKIIKDFASFPKFSPRYCAFSEKALKKLIPLIQKGNSNKKYSWENEDWYQKWQESNEIRKQEILKIISEIDFTQDQIDWKKYSNIDSVLPWPKGLFSAFKEFENMEEFKNLNLTQASYLVYGRHSELERAIYWTSPNDIRKQLHQELKQHSLNNPVAEKVILEMMQVVADIWDYYGEGKSKYFSKIHLEVGRELKKSIKEKESESKRMSDNRSQNKRIRQILEEFLSINPYNANPNYKDHFDRLKIVEEGAEHTKNTDKEFFNNKPYSKKDIEEILKKPHITINDFKKYKLWVEQGYRSPYSGQIIKFSDLFDGSKYNIDHIFPQASITNDSLSNKVVVEVALNKLKSNKTARAFIQSQGGQSHLGIPICTESKYINIVKTQFSGTKRYILLSKEIPKGFTNSQKNNMRHISRKAMELLSHVVREPGEIEFRSKNILPVTGRVTTKLKKAWSLNQVWKELVAPRYIRLNELTQSNLFGNWQTSKNGQRYFDCDLDKIIRERDESYSIKRIDHRHHALDALIVALCTEDHVNYINNFNADAKSDNYGKQKQIEKYRSTLKRKIKFTKRDNEQDEKNWHYMLPGEIRNGNSKNSQRDSVLEMSYYDKAHNSYGQDYKKMILTTLQNTIVTFKQNLRVINSTVNRYNNTSNKNSFKKQNNKNGQKRNWAIRKQLSKETVYGKRMVNGEEWRVERELLNDKFNKAKINKITDKGVKRILTNHLANFDTVKLSFEEGINYLDALMELQEFEAILNDSQNEFKSFGDLVEHLRSNEYKYNKIDYSKLNIFINKVPQRDFRNEKLNNGKDKFEIEEHPELAFSPTSIEKMNAFEELRKLNGDKNHMPIKKVQTFQRLGKERPISENNLSVKSKQYVVTAAGSNLYLGFYESVYLDDKDNELKERKFEDIGLMELIETLKQDQTKRLNPLPNAIFNDKLIKYDWLFTLSPLDLVFVPTEEEIENPSMIDFKNLTKEQVCRIYKYVDGTKSYANFIPFSYSKTITIDKLKINGVTYQGEITLTTKKDKQQRVLQNFHNSLDDNTMIKECCWKLNMDRLGNISKVIY